MLLTQPEPAATNAVCLIESYIKIGIRILREKRGDVSSEKAQKKEAVGYFYEMLSGAKSLDNDNGFEA